MPFISGQTIVGNEKNMPWVQDGTYNFIMQKSLFRWYSNNKASYHVMDHAQTLSMLYLLKHFCPQIRETQWQYRKTIWGSDTVNHMKEDKTLPEALTPNANQHTWTAERPGFKIVENFKFNQTAFPALDQFYKDEKPVSMILQESPTHRVRIYKHDHYYTILTSAWTFDMCRKIIALIPRLFNLELPGNIARIFMLFGTDQYKEWEQEYNNWIQSLKLLDTIRLKKLTDALNVQNTAHATKLRNDIKRAENDIEQYVNTIRGIYDDQQRYQRELYALEQEPVINAEDLFQYLNRNKAIKSYTIDVTTLYLVIETAWNYYDENAIKTILDNPKADVNINKEFSLFIGKTYCPEPMFELWSQAHIYINLTENTFSTASQDNLTMIPQTHLHQFGCWGNNKAYIQKALSTKNYIGAIEQMISACKNLNWYDGPVIRRLRDYITNTHNYRFRQSIKHIETNNFITFDEAIKIMIKKEMEQNAVHQDNPGTETTTDEPVRDLPF